MSYITREDGVRFIIPSYRDVLSVKKTSLLKREILLLASNYGEYITLQKKNINQYEIAFSPDPGALLGETVWQYFKRPRDLIYCEVIPNTTDAILVIVKSGSVYLDGSFPIDSIPEELVIFQTQQNQFDIYLYGNVPISQTPTEGKFSFDPSSVKSFTILNSPVFPTLPVVKTFQLQLVDVVLKNQGIGTFPVKKVTLSVLVLALVWMAWIYLKQHRKEIVIPQAFVNVVTPYQGYMSKLNSPNPAAQIHEIVNDISLLFSIPGWDPRTFVYSAADNKGLSALVTSLGARTNVLYDWANKNKVQVELRPTGFYLVVALVSKNRPVPTTIYKLDHVIANLIDRLSYIIPGNPVGITAYLNQGRYLETQVTISFENLSPNTLNVVGEQLKMLPLILSKVDLTATNGSLSGSIVLTALGN